MVGSADKTFIFDLDDTLMWNRIDYEFTELKFLDFVLARLGHLAPDSMYILKMLDSTNIKNIETMGYSKHRFPTSMMEVYRKICQAENILDVEGEKQAYNIGATVFDAERWKQRGLVEGAEETLDFLANERGDRLMILTKGDMEIQSTKISVTGLDRWFGQNIYIVPDKNRKVFASIIDGFDINAMWMVGNSEKSDVQPAILNRVKAIYIPYETWSVEVVKKGLPDSPLITRFEKIIEIKENYDLLK